jgi:transaldolase/glucose-6-phosphate isomerase
MPRISFALGAYEARVDERVRRWTAEEFARRLWAKDHTLWSKVPLPEITDRVGWLDLPRRSQDEVPSWSAFRDEILGEEFTNIILLGMGGSSLAPEVFQATFGNAPCHPPLAVLDSTHPEAILDLEKQVDLKGSLVLVSSKSGTTIETISLFRHFDLDVAALRDGPRSHFVAVTDPETPLVRTAALRKFRRVFSAPTDIGGRYSALSAFGLLPAVLIGMDVNDVLARARTMAESCGPGDAESGLRLGAALGELALAGRDKVTFITSPSLASFPQWLEQLIAESSGKDGKGIIPIVDEPLDDPTSYGGDRVFVGLEVRGEMPREHQEHLSCLESQGHPVVRIEMDQRSELGAEMFRWEVAVAAACAVLEVHPFNQPDVEISKQIARKVMHETEDVGHPGDRDAALSRDTAAAWSVLGSLLAGAGAGDYVCLQAYLAPSRDVADALQKLRLVIRRRTGLATTVGYGPRFLHSTGQLHKGGPNTGIFIQLVDRSPRDFCMTGETSSWGNLIRAQSLGDYQALVQRKRRVVRIDLGSDPIGSLVALARDLEFGKM